MPNGHDKNPPKICYQKWGPKELELGNNEIYIVIGSKAAKQLFPHDKFEDLVFKDNTYNGKPAYVIPHPSPLNRRWLNKHLDFLDKRMPIIRKKIKEVLNIK